MVLQVYQSSKRRMNNSTPKPPSKHNLVWIDLEMTGLDLEKHRIVEIACLVTNKNLEVVEPGKDIVIHHPEEVLQEMTDWCRDVHTQTGLTQAVRDSKVDIEEAERIVLEYVKRHCPERSCPLAGNTIYMDRMFLYRYMPTLNEYLHYRVVDVSSMKELCKRWNGEIFSKAPPKSLKHRALQDIEESIGELKYYKQYMFATHSNC
ncbi:oligoribonuclease isoform X2 [Toxorhynchites rutilus septentrionalis]|uniref:oligoribonuclease isoform X2 n=1 Tax=Toxorhynchites rutilus septentrionalis TaxID=329112 RepID=UPI0024791B0B|nr:oligoribonuclease isoform X2 [Toxorhynchites rutilus septentrionalis]